MEIHILNGPNLNLLGKREPEIYGYQSFDDYFKYLQSKYPQHQLHYFQSNIEGELIDYLQKVSLSEGIVLNAGGYTHTSVSLADAIAAIEAPVIEVHISNLWKRESYRHESLIGAQCIGTIGGFGLLSYSLAIEALQEMPKK